MVVVRWSVAGVTALLSHRSVPADKGDFVRRTMEKTSEFVTVSHPSYTHRVLWALLCGTPHRFIPRTPFFRLPNAFRTKGKC